MKNCYAPNMCDYEAHYRGNTWKVWASFSCDAFGLELSVDEATAQYIQKRTKRLAILSGGRGRASFWRMIMGVIKNGKERKEKKPKQKKQDCETETEEIYTHLRVWSETYFHKQSFD